MAKIRDRQTASFGETAPRCQAQFRRAARRLDALMVFIEDCQRRHPADMPEVTPLAMLKHLMEQQNMTVTELGRVIGSQSNASLILSGKRAISKRVMRLLSQHFSVAPGVFL